MYHYVRPPSAELPYFQHLDITDFRLQLDWLAERWRFVAPEELRRCGDRHAKLPEGVVLTFDDGLADHWQWVIPELLRRQIAGIFYVSTGAYRSGKMLDVHRIHYILGRLGVVEALSRVEAALTKDMFTHDHIEAFHTQTYVRHREEEARRRFKRIFNYFLATEHRGVLLDCLMADLVDETALMRRWYMSPEEIAAAQAQGMVIGSHSVSHPVMSRLQPAEQRAEIDQSFADLDGFTGGLPFRTFCYPYGGFHSFTADTERLLADAGCLFAFNVEQRDIETRDWQQRPSALPRWDCNQFPHGQIAKQGHESQSNNAPST